MKWQRRISGVSANGAAPVYDYRLTAQVDGKPWVFDVTRSGIRWLLTARDGHGAVRRRRKYPNLNMARTNTEAFITRQQQKGQGS